MKVGNVLRSGCALIISLACCGSASADISVLPLGANAPALSSAHFPDRVHEFVWRNWNAVPPAKIAAILDTGEGEVTEMAVSMGLPAEADVPPAMRERGYVTLIRRNWHLLPYGQLLALLDMTPERLDEMLREEDFLWHKLGQTKPAAEPIVYAPPSDAAKARAAEIKAVVEADFGAALTEPGEPRFDFVRQLSTPVADFVAPVQAEGEKPFLRIVHSYVAVFGDPLMNPELNPYPDGFLQRLANNGINGVWLHAVLRDLAPGGETFPEFGADHETRLKNLRPSWHGRKPSGSIFIFTSMSPEACPTASSKTAQNSPAQRVGSSPPSAPPCPRCESGWATPWPTFSKRCPDSAVSTPSLRRKT